MKSKRFNEENEKQQRLHQSSIITANQLSFIILVSIIFLVLNINLVLINGHKILDNAHDEHHHPHHHRERFQDKVEVIDRHRLKNATTLPFGNHRNYHPSNAGEFNTRSENDPNRNHIQRDHFNSRTVNRINPDQRHHIEPDSIIRYQNGDQADVGVLNRGGTGANIDPMNYQINHDRNPTNSVNDDRINIEEFNRAGVGANIDLAAIHRNHSDLIEREDNKNKTTNMTIQFNNQNHIYSGTFNRIQAQPDVSVEYDRTNVIGTNSSNIRSGIKPQTTGTAVPLTNLENVDVEAINKARIWAEQASEEQAKKHAQNVVRLAATDQLESEIITNRTRAYLSCESGEMIVKINFTQPFRGVGYADYDRSSPCKFYGDGGRYYEMRLPLKGCGTKQEAPRIFINNIILRFHRSLELEEDEIKTIICRYPPPLAPPPPLIAAPILEQPPPLAPFIPAKLSEVELLLIVSALLFLTLLLLGIGIGYYCLKKRKIKVVRKFVPPEIPYFPPPSISSEEHSIISEASIIQHDDYQFQNLGFIPEAKLSYLDDIFYNDQDLIDEDIVLTQQNVIVPPVPQFNTKKFDDHFITQASETDIDTDIEVDRLIVPKKPKITTLITEDYFVTPKTTTEIIDEVTTQRIIVPPKKPLTSKYVDDTMITPQDENVVEDEMTRQRMFGPTKLFKQNLDDLYVHSESETEFIDDITKNRIYGPDEPPRVTSAKQDDYFRSDVYEIHEIVHDLSDTKMHPVEQPTTRIMQTEDDEIITHSKDVEEFIDDTNYRLVSKKQSPPPPKKKPKFTVQNIDDFYITNITETETNEQITKIGRSMPNLILQVDHEEQEQLEESSRLTGFDIKMRSIPRKPDSQPTIRTTFFSESTKINEILRILENPPREKIPNLDNHFMLPTRNRFRKIILTDEVFRTLIIESTTIEEYVERIQHHPTYGPLFEPPTWEVIFRLLSLPEVDIKRPKGKYSDTYKSGVSAQEVRSVTEEDVTFTRSRLSTTHFVPLPDYPMDDDEQPKPSHWASQLPDPKPYDRYSPDFTPIKPAFGTTRRYGRQRPDLSSSRSSIFGPRRLENPYAIHSPSTARKRLFDYDLRPYSPDLDALSLEPSQSYLAYSGSVRNYIQSEELKEEIKSTTETNVYDWKRYS